MKYILIVGNGYKDCKAKLDSINKEAGVNYGLVTKAKHLQGIPFSSVIEADGAQLNPHYAEIMKIAKVRKIKGIKPKKSPVVKEVVEDKPIVEIVDEEFKNKLDELIGKGELDFDSEEPMIEEEPLPPLVEIINEPAEDIVAVPLIDELPEEEKPEVETVWVNELVDDLPDVDEPLDEPVVEEPEVEVAPEDVKPVNPPRGWHARNEFIDETGQVFHKGLYVGEIGDAE